MAGGWSRIRRDAGAQEDLAEAMRLASGLDARACSRSPTGQPAGGTSPTCSPRARHGAALAGSRPGHRARVAARTSETRRPSPASSRSPRRSSADDHVAPTASRRSRARSSLHRPQVLHLPSARCSRSARRPRRRRRRAALARRAAPAPRPGATRAPGHGTSHDHAASRPERAPGTSSDHPRVGLGRRRGGATSLPERVAVVEGRCEPARITHARRREGADSAAGQAAAHDSGDARKRTWGRPPLASAVQKPPASSPRPEPNSQPESSALYVLLGERGDRSRARPSEIACDVSGMSRNEQRRSEERTRATAARLGGSGRQRRAGGGGDRRSPRNAGRSAR